MHPSEYYVGVVNPRRDTRHIITDKNEPYDLEVVVVDYGTLYFNTTIMFIYCFTDGKLVPNVPVTIALGDSAKLNHPHPHNVFVTRSLENVTVMSSDKPVHASIPVPAVNGMTL